MSLVNFFSTSFFQFKGLAFVLKSAVVERKPNIHTNQIVHHNSNHFNSKSYVEKRWCIHSGLYAQLLTIWLGFKSCCCRHSFFVFLSMTLYPDCLSPPRDINGYQLLGHPLDRTLTGALCRG